MLVSAAELWTKCVNNNCVGVEITPTSSTYLGAASEIPGSHPHMVA